MATALFTPIQQRRPAARSAAILKSHKTRVRGELVAEGIASRAHSRYLTKEISNQVIQMSALEKRTETDPSFANVKTYTQFIDWTTSHPIPYSEQRALWKQLVAYRLGQGKYRQQIQEIRAERMQTRADRQKAITSSVQAIQPLSDQPASPLYVGSSPLVTSSSTTTTTSQISPDQHAVPVANTSFSANAAPASTSSSKQQTATASLSPTPAAAAVGAAVATDLPLAVSAPVATSLSPKTTSTLIVSTSISSSSPTLNKEYTKIPTIKIEMTPKDTGEITKTATRAKTYVRPLHVGLVSGVTQTYHNIRNESQQRNKRKDFYEAQRQHVRDIYAPLKKNKEQLINDAKSWSLIAARAPQLQYARSEKEFEEIRLALNKNGQNISGQAWQMRKAEEDLRKLEEAEKEEKERLADIDKAEEEAAKIKKPEATTHGHVTEKGEEKEKEKEKEDEAKKSPQQTQEARTQTSSSSPTDIVVSIPLDPKTIQARDNYVNNQVLLAQHKARQNGKMLSLAEVLSLRQELTRNFSPSTVTSAKTTSVTFVNPSSAKTQTPLHPVSSSSITKLDNIIKGETAPRQTRSQTSKQHAQYLQTRQAVRSFGQTFRPMHMRSRFLPIPTGSSSFGDGTGGGDGGGDGGGHGGGRSGGRFSRPRNNRARNDNRRQPSPTRAVEDTAKDTVKAVSFLIRIWVALPFLAVLLLIFIATVSIIFILTGGLRPNPVKAGTIAGTSQVTLTKSASSDSTNGMVANGAPITYTISVSAPQIEQEIDVKDVLTFAIVGEPTNVSPALSQPYNTTSQELDWQFLNTDAGTISFTVQPAVHDTQVYNQATATVVGGTNGTQAIGNEASAPPSQNDCNGAYDLATTGIGNYGDPICTLAGSNGQYPNELNLLTQQLIQIVTQDNNPKFQCNTAITSHSKINGVDPQVYCQVQEFMNIMSYESGDPRNPTSPRNPNSMECAINHPTCATGGHNAYGLMQMNPQSAHGVAYDIGDVDWQQQLFNAIHRDDGYLSLNPPAQMCYWASARPSVFGYSRNCTNFGQ